MSEQKAEWPVNGSVHTMFFCFVLFFMWGDKCKRKERSIDLDRFFSCYFITEYQEHLRCV